MEFALTHALPKSMKPETNTATAETVQTGGDQALPAHRFAGDPQGRIAFCWKLTFRERLRVLL